MNDDNNSVKIRGLRLEEHETWFAMRQLLWPDHTRQEFEEEKMEFLDDPNRNTVLVAALPNGELVGFVEVSLRDWAQGCSTHPVGYIEGWYVQPAHRRSGIGRRLIEAAEDWARTKGCTEMGSDAEDWNVVSHMAHRALGYAEAIRLVCFSKKIDP